MHETAVRLSRDLKSSAAVDVISVVAGVAAATAGAGKSPSFEIALDAVCRPAATPSVVRLADGNRCRCTRN
jgi:hypothetical protein